MDVIRAVIAVIVVKMSSEANQISQKEYLKKYLSGSKSSGKKKKTKKNTGTGIKIIDDDVDISKMKPLEESELEIFGDPEEAPQIVGVIDERAEELKKLGQFTSNRWKVVAQDDGFDSSIKIEQISQKIKLPEVFKRSSDSDSDLSPMRKSDNSEINSFSQKTHTAKVKQSTSKSNYVSKNNSDSDLSPIRTKNRSPHNQDTDSDLSPPRKRSHKDDSLFKIDKYKSKSTDKYYYENNKHRERRSRWENEEKDKNKRNEHKDYKVNTDHKHKNTVSNNNKEKGNNKNQKMTTTLEGKKAGLQDSKGVRIENEELKRKEEEFFEKLSDEVIGKNASTVKRNLKRGQKQTEAEIAAQREREEKQKELEAKYSRWGKGIKQAEVHESRIKDFLEESSKPLARYKDDEDLDKRLKEVERLEDPMLEYMRKKKQQSNGKDTSENYPTYKGPYPPNRFEIRPGYRWDGVDRSNGYEKQYFKVKTSRQAQEEEVYKWSTEDM